MVGCMQEQGGVMDINDILYQLAHAEGLPKEALRDAAERREEIVPVFLREVDEYLASDAEARDEFGLPLFFIFHLLGDWREKKAYRPLARLLRCESKEMDGLLGDCITETTHRVMAAVFDGDPQPLYDVILDAKADEYIRSRMCEALAMAVLRGELDRKEAARFLRDGFMNLEPQAECYVWQGWQRAISMLGLEEFKGLVKKAFDRGFIDEQWLGFNHFEEDLKRGIENPGEPRWPDDKQYTLFGDTIEEMSTWYGFSEKYKEDQDRRRQAREGRSSHSQSALNLYKNVGRNDPCPCGSGKKFKKCCLH